MDTAPNFRPMSVVAKNARMDQDATGTEVGRGPGYVVLHGDSAPPQRGIDAPPWPIFIVAKRLDGSR